jgi:two-component system CheB/CheR fusion protein
LIFSQEVIMLAGKKEPREKKSSSGKKAPAKETKKSPRTDAFPVVGLGASAGGLEAFETFFKNVPANSGMAFVVVTHLDPTHISLMPELIQKHTAMKVVQVKEGMKLQRDHVYVIPPDNDMGINNGTLVLAKQKIGSGPRAPVNYFLRSLAETVGERAVCIILSGMGTDGTEGVKAIKGKLGMVMVQDPGSAKYDSMPRNVIGTGLVDYILPPDQMPRQLLEYVKHTILGRPPKAVSPKEIASKDLEKIHMLLRAASGHDFSSYKESTILRRIQRRMDIHKIEGVSHYLRYLEGNENEVKTLFKELLIGVTAFFREPEAFEVLRTRIIPMLLKDKPYNYNLRMWVPGCATGEEAYSLAIVLKECMDEMKSEFSVQVFATDIDSEAIETARIGLYPGNIGADVGQERLAKFFESTDNSYRINRNIREMLIFAPQSLIKDPPFTRMDLICCRNVLIYLQPELQKKLLNLFYYSLNPGGILFLGSSETVGNLSDLFELVERKWKIYRHRGKPPDHHPLAPFPFTAQQRAPGRVALPKSSKRELPRVVEKHLMEHYTPPSVIIEPDGTIAYIHGRTGAFMELSAGPARSNNILEMARDGLKAQVPLLIRRAINERREASAKLYVKQNGNSIPVLVTVKPMSEPKARGLYMVVFEVIRVEEKAERRRKDERKKQREPDRVAELEEELRYSKESLQTTVEELETSNEELRSINEEYQSANEELQSANEELNSSKEELQSLNEEIETVNAELQDKNLELTKVNDDMKNLLDNLEIPTIYLDSNLCINRFTSHAERVINLRDADIGRPLGDLVTRIKHHDLLKDAKEVLETLAPKEFEVETLEGRWYLTRIRPYRTMENLIEGLVITFVDIHDRKLSEMELERSRCFSENIFDAVREPIVVLDKDLRLVSANRSFYATFRVTPEETEGKKIYDLGNKQWDIPELRRLLEEIIPKNSVFEGFEVDHDFPDVGRKNMLLNARKIGSPEGAEDFLLLAIEDITDKNSDQ